MPTTSFCARNMLWRTSKRCEKNTWMNCAKGEHPIETGCEEKRKPWDAVYAHSWGRIVIQMYAKTYPQSVNALILSAPVSRASEDTGAAWRTMIVDNLLDIYRKHRSTKCSWPSDEDFTGGNFAGEEKQTPSYGELLFLRGRQVEVYRKQVESTS